MTQRLRGAHKLLNALCNIHSEMTLWLFPAVYISFVISACPCAAAAWKRPDEDLALHHYFSNSARKSEGDHVQ